MKNFLRLSFGFILLCISLFSCKETLIEDNIDFGYDYFPQEVGKYISYEVDSIIYDQISNFTIIDTNSLQVTERFVEEFDDNSGETTYRIERYERKNAGQAWQIKDVWTSKRTNTKAERIEENLRFVKMIFPASVETNPWNGNAFLDETTIIPIAGESVVIFKNWLYEYVEKDEPYSINGFDFDSTMTVLQANEENLIELRYSEEVYAKNVGLIFKEMKILDTQCISDCAGQTWEQKAEKGFIVRMKVFDHNW